MKALKWPQVHAWRLSQHGLLWGGRGGGEAHCWHSSTGHVRG
jgi:hypothetical protein